jgi:hypothetical protein
VDVQVPCLCFGGWRTEASSPESGEGFLGVRRFETPRVGTRNQGWGGCLSGHVRPAEHEKSKSNSNSEKWSNP